MKKIFIGIMFFSVLSFFINNANIFAQNNILSSSRLEKSSLDKIYSEYLKNDISIDKWAIYTAYAMFDNSKLPIEFHSSINEKCRSWIFDEYLKNWDRINSITKKQLMKFGFLPNGTMARPDTLDSTAETGHFLIHYTTNPSNPNAISSWDGNSNGFPDYLEMVINAFEDAWTFEIDSMGYTAPPSDGNEGGNKKFDVYIIKYKGGDYGLTYGSKIVRDNPNSTVIEKNAWTSYITIRNEYNNFSVGVKNAINVTAAHEFFHAIQNGYDGWEQTWLKESTATWMEDEVFDDVNDNYQYLNSVFDSPWIPLDKDSTQHKYGTWIFFRFLSEHLQNRNVIKLIWEKSIKYNSYHEKQSIIEIKEALSQLGKNFPNEFIDFWIANLYKTDGPYVYEEGNSYPDVKILRNFWGSYTNINYTAERHSAIYFRLAQNLIPDGQDNIKLSFSQTDSNTNFALVITSKNESGNVNIKTLLSNGGNIIYTIDSTINKRDIRVIVINTDTMKSAFKLNIISKGKMFKIAESNMGNNYFYKAHLFGDYLIYPSFKMLADNKTDGIINYFNLRSGADSHFKYHNVNILNPFLSKSNGDMALQLQFMASEKTYLMGYHLGKFKTLATSPYDTSSKYPHFEYYYLDYFANVDSNKIIFYGSKTPPKDPGNKEGGIWQMNLDNANPKKLVPIKVFQNIEELSKLIADGNSFVYSKYFIKIEKQELYRYNNASYSPFYSIKYSDGDIRRLAYNDNLATWFVWDKKDNNQKIWVRDFSNDSAKIIATSNYTELDYTSLATAKKRVVWTKSHGTINNSTWWIYVWENNTVKLIGESKWFVMDQDNDEHYDSGKRLSISDNGVAWMQENRQNGRDYILNYYDFNNSKLTQLDLSNKFGYYPHLSILLSNNHLIIEVPYNEGEPEKTGIYYIDIQGITTGVHNNTQITKKDLNQLKIYPNPFNDYIKINFKLVKSQILSIELVNNLGFSVTGEKSIYFNSGYNTYNLNCANIPSGIYYCVIKSKSGILINKLIHIK